MRKWIALLFILALSSTLLPAVLSYEQKKVVLFSTVEEEQPDGGKQIKIKDDTKALLQPELYIPAFYSLYKSYPRLSVLFSDDPVTGMHTPPPDLFC